MKIEISQETYDKLKEQILAEEDKLKEKSKKTIKIKNRWDGNVIYESEKTTYKEAVEEAISKEVELTEANLTGAELTGANLTGAELTEANLTVAVLTGAELTEANLTGARLKGADLEGAVLRGADLKGADLYGAKFYGKTDNDNYKTRISKGQLDNFLEALGIKLV